MIRLSSLVLLVFVVLAGLQAHPAWARGYCETYSDGRSRCVIEGTGTAKVRVENVSDSEVLFTVSEWQSKCNEPGSSVLTKDYRLGPGKNVSHELGNLGSAKTCRELFVFGCRKEGNKVSCAGNLNISAEP
jgi:hypothetical protein